MNLKEAVELSLHGFLDIQECESIFYAKGRVKPIIDYLRGALAEDAMKRLTDEQQMIERGTKAWAGVPDATAWVEDLRGNEPVTDCHEKEGDKLAPPLDHIPDATKMMAHFGITSADSNVNVAYLHKQLDDFLTAAIGCSRGGDKLTRPLKKVEECEYPRCLSSSGCERQCPAFPRCKDADTGETSDVPETNFGNIAQSIDSTGADQSEDALEMVATSQESRQVEPVAWRYIPSERLRDVVLTSDPRQARLAADYGCEVQPLYPAPPKRERRDLELAEAYRYGWDGGVKAEREECAKLCDAEMSPDPLQPTTAHMAGQYEMAEYLGQVIRQRGEK